MADPGTSTSGAREGSKRAHTCSCHCSSCGRHFTSLGAFDRHLVGAPEWRGCETPHEVGLVPLEGECRISDDRTVAGTLWERPDTRGDSERLAAR